jgi:hypothetical protein
MSSFFDLRLPAKKAWQGSEDSLQKECARWLKKELYNRKLPQVFYHPPNGGSRHIAEASKLKLMGVNPGVPDVVLPLRAGMFSGLYCELKKAGGAISKDQKIFLQALSEEGYLCLVVNDLDTFIENVTQYLNLRNAIP